MTTPASLRSTAKRSKKGPPKQIPGRSPGPLPCRRPVEEGREVVVGVSERACPARVRIETARLRRLHAFDRLLLLVLVPVWLACFALSVRAILRPAGATSFRVTAWPAESSHPEVVALAPFVLVDEVGVRRGDRLVRMAGEDMRGVGSLRFYARFLSAAWSRERVPAVVERGQHAFETTLASVSWAAFAPLVAIAPLFAFFGVAILLKAPRSGVAQATCQAFLAGAFFLPLHRAGRDRLAPRGGTLPLVPAGGVR